VLRLQVPEQSGERCVRSYFAKELKQDKIKETIEHGAEAVISHGQFTLIVVFGLLWWWRSAMAAGGFMSIAGLWKPRRLRYAMKPTRAAIGSAPDPADLNEPSMPMSHPRSGCFAKVHQGCR